MYHAVPLMEGIFLNFEDLQECAVMKKTIMLVINDKLLNFLNRAIGIISLERSFTDTMN